MNIPAMFSTFCTGVLVILAIAIPSAAQQQIKPNRPIETHPSMDQIYPRVPSEIMEAKLVQTDGSKMQLKDLRGKVILLNLWAIWTGFSRGQIPGFVELQKKYQKRNVVVIGLDVGDQMAHQETLRVILRYARQMKINYPLVRATEPAPTLKAIYAITKVSAIPQTIIIDMDGRLRGVYVGGGPRVERAVTDMTEKVFEDSKGQALLQGTITDSMGALIPNVEISAKGQDGIKYEWNTDASGEYVTILKPDIYTLTFTRSPFASAVFQKYQIGANARMTLDVSLVCENCTPVD